MPDLPRQRVADHAVLPLSAAGRMQLGRHQRTTGLLANFIAQTLGMNQDSCSMIEKAAGIHDIGKIPLSGIIIEKPGPLTSDEIQTVRLHPIIGYTYLKAFGRSPFLDMAAEIALEHHERWDGKGYPFGKSGEQISLPSRITSVCDVYSALRESRPYKLGQSHDCAMREILSSEATPGANQFDPLVIRALVRNESLFRQMGDYRNGPHPGDALPPHSAGLH